MKILMIAPEPVFSIRGTPFSVRDRCRALSDLGHTVDLLTYPFGDDIRFEGLRIHRIRRVPGIREVKIGFSPAKIPLDGLLFAKAFLALRRQKYDLIHTHEEAGMIGAVLGRWFRTPHLYDMHSSLPQQFDNYGTKSPAFMTVFMRWAERYILKRSRAVIAICPHLKAIALKAFPGAGVEIIENLAQLPDTDPSPEEIRGIREEYRLETHFTIGYTGTFEINQGLDLLMEAFGVFSGEVENAVLLLAGGEPEQVETAGQRARILGIADKVRIPGKLPAERMGAVMAACDVLASPRATGTNTPLKIYSYMRSGVPVLATNLLTHTQVLDAETAVLTEPSVPGLTDGLRRLYRDPDLGKRLAAAARVRAETRYSYPVYKEKVRHVINAACGLREE
ncbi:glycosyltransferase [bacterium]|nr:glycosyltransferase [candidate division CSSED10-310 bacterium]